MMESESSTDNVSSKSENAFFSAQNIIDNYLTNVCLLVLTWAVSWSIVGSDCLPGGNLFGLIILIDCCILAGKLVDLIHIPKLPPLPSLLGMLLAGFALRNIPGINFAAYIDPAWSSALRLIALTVILVKAGLELDAAALKKMKGVCVRLTAIPCLVESTACAISCYLLLGFGWEWGFLLGFVLGAVTPAVIVPSLLTLQEKGYGTQQGIPTLVIAASSFDDVLAISGFSVVLGIAFSSVSSATDNGVSTTAYGVTDSSNASWQQNATTASTTLGDPGAGAGSIVLTIFRGPLEMIGGIAAGILMGVCLWYVPTASKKGVTLIRTLFVTSLGILSIFGSQIAGFPGSGALAAIVLSFVASVRWQDEKIPVSENMSLLWRVFEPIMFGLIGAEITIESLDPDTVGLGIAVLAIGLLFRALATFGAVTFAGLNLREKIFVCLAWMPKATVQAAIGPLALDFAKEQNAPDDIIKVTKQILTIAVLSILITAPLGAAAIGLTGPSLLQSDKKDDNDRKSHGSEEDFTTGDTKWNDSENVPLKKRSVSHESSPKRNTGDSVIQL